MEIIASAIAIIRDVVLIAAGCMVIYFWWNEVNEA